MKAENVEWGNCEEFVFIMYAYRNDDKIMHKQCNTGGETINLLNNVEPLGDAMIICFVSSSISWLSRLIFILYYLEKKTISP